MNNDDDNSNSDMGRDSPEQKQEKHNEVTHCDVGGSTGLSWFYHVLT